MLYWYIYSTVHLCLKQEKKLKIYKFLADFRILGFIYRSGLSDRYSDFTAPDPTNLPAIDNKNIFLTPHHWTKFSYKQINSTGGQSKTSYYQLVTNILKKRKDPNFYPWQIRTDQGSTNVTDPSESGTLVYRVLFIGKTFLPHRTVKKE